jgi:DNA mismatch repair protein MutL
MTIRRLPPETVNRIAAGEVVERPASAVKELVENALDAGASRVEIAVENGGLTRILVADDGCGLSRDELPLAVERHATSKLQPGADGGWDLLNITTRGFRGEALPSIGSVSRLHICSRGQGEADAWAVRVDAGALDGPAPAAFPEPHGARIEVRDLFYATPARLKFMKSARAEALAISDEVRRQAMARPDAAFTLEIDGRRTFRLPAETGEGGRLVRLSAVLGREFACTATRACPPTTAARRATSTSSSTAAPCGTGCCRGRFAPPTRTCWRATGIRWRRSTWSSSRCWSTSTSIRPRRRSASATRPGCGG